jgi:hypothetical protein
MGLKGVITVGNCRIMVMGKVEIYPTTDHEDAEEE